MTHDGMRLIRQKLSPVPITTSELADRYQSALIARFPHPNIGPTTVKEDNMNPLIQEPAFYDYYKFDEWEVVPANPNDPSSDNVIELKKPGILRLANDITSLIKQIQTRKMHNPREYIDQWIKETIDESSASSEFKQRVNPNTWIRTKTNTGKEVLIRDVRLREIVTDTYRRKFPEGEPTIEWRSDYPAALISKFENADLEDEYSAEVERELNTPEMKFARKVMLKHDLENRLKWFVNQTNPTDLYKELVHSYFNGAAQLSIVSLDSAYSSVKLANVAYLSDSNETHHGGILIFLEAPLATSVITLPEEGYDRRKFIEKSDTLSDLIFTRVPKYRYKFPRGSKLAYYKSQVGGLASPLKFHRSEDPFGQLHDLHLRLIGGDMDLLVWSDEERFADNFMSQATQLLLAVATLSSALALLLPAGFAVVAFVAGVSAGLVSTLRSIEEDDPELAAQHIETAIEQLRAAIITPFVEKFTEALGESVRNEVDAHVTRNLARG